MRRIARVALGTLLVLAGLAFIAFFTLLLLIADCSSGCVERGERAPIFAFWGLGALLIVLGLRQGAAGTMRAAGEAMLVGGLVCLAGLAWTMSEGARGTFVWVTLAIGAGVAAIGAWLRFWRPR